MTDPNSPTPGPVARPFRIALAAALRLAFLIDRMPHADPLALLRARVVAERAAAEDWGEQEVATQVWRKLDRLALFRHFGSGRGWSSARVLGLSSDELLRLLEDEPPAPTPDAPAARPDAA